MATNNRCDYFWRPAPGDTNSYVWRNGRWELEDDLEVDETTFEMWEERRRQRLAIRNEY